VQDQRVEKNHSTLTCKKEQENRKENEIELKLKMKVEDEEKGEDLRVEQM
jgi:hypothetical protein